MLGRAEHRGPLMGQRHGRRSPGAAHFSYDGGAAHPVVTVLVVGTQWRQLLAIIQVRHGFVPGFGVPYALPGETRGLENARGEVDNERSPFDVPPGGPRPLHLPAARS